MRFIYCPDCAEQLIHRNLGDEKNVPWCEKCNRPFFDVFYSCVITLCRYKDKYAVIKQSYGDTEKHVLVSGYIKVNEDASHAAAREVKEEIGLDCTKLRVINTYAYSKKEMLMIGVLADVSGEEFALSGEVKTAQWCTAEEAAEKLKDSSIARILLEDVLKYEKEKN